MTVDNAIAKISQIIGNTLADYNQSPDSTKVDATGATVRIPHPLDIVDPTDKLFALDMALKDVALKATPVSLIETTGSTASELKRVSTDYFIRVPTEPIAGIALDIDDGLAYAVVFKALALLWREYGDYNQRADSIINTYIQAYRQYLTDLIAGVVSQGAQTYVRFSADGTNWHSSFTTGDIFISFKRIDTNTWTPAIKFVGSDGAQGVAGTPCKDTLFTALSDTPASYTGMAGKVVAVNPTENGVEFIAPPAGGTSTGATTFTALTDTPATLTAGQYLKVDATGTGLVLTPPPTAGVAGANVFMDNVFFDNASSGIMNLDLSSANIMYLYPTANAELHFTKFNDGGVQVDAWWGTTYTFMLVSIGNNAITFDPTVSIIGDKTVGLGSTSATTGITMTIIKMIYTGYDWYVVSNTKIADANG
jgi:hypothetical protein